MKNISEDIQHEINEFSRITQMINFRDIPLSTMKKYTEYSYELNMFTRDVLGIRQDLLE